MAAYAGTCWDTALAWEPTDWSLANWQRPAKVSVRTQARFPGSTLWCQVEREGSKFDLVPSFPNLDEQKKIGHMKSSFRLALGLESLALGTARIFFLVPVSWRVRMYTGVRQRAEQAGHLRH